MIRALAQLLAACCLWMAAAAAQEVFVSRGSGSPVYSDRQQNGAKPVTLAPLNVIAPVPVAKTATPATAANAAANAAASGRPASAEAAKPVYRSLRIVFPEDGGSVAASPTVFDVRLTLEPALQLGAGHAIVVSINGRLVGQRFAASEFAIPPEFWGETLPPVNRRYQLDAAIIDRNGALLKSALPVSFTLRPIYLQQRPHHPQPATRPRVDELKAPASAEAWTKRLMQPGPRLLEPPGR